MTTDLLLQDQILWPVIFSGGTKIEFAPSVCFESAYFGGPLQQKFTGKTFGAEPLHRVFTFSPGTLPQPNGHHLQGRLGVFFGMRYNGCELEYKVPVLRGVNAQYIEETTPLTVVNMSPLSSNEDWPYTDYPRLLPYVQLQEASRTSIEAREFAEKYTWQGIDDISETDLVVVVPAVAAAGASLWGRDGGDAAVQIIYRYSYTTHHATVSTQCT